MIANLIIVAAAIALAVIAFFRGLAIGKKIGLNERMSTALPRELVPTRQLRRAAGRQIGKRIADASKTAAPVILLAIAIALQGCSQLTGVKPRARECTRSYRDTVEVYPDSTTPTTIKLGACK